MQFISTHCVTYYATSDEPEAQFVRNRQMCATRFRPFAETLAHRCHCCYFTLPHSSEWHVPDGLVSSEKIIILPIAFRRSALTIRKTIARVCDPSVRTVRRPNIARTHERNRFARRKHNSRSRPTGCCFAFYCTAFQSVGGIRKMGRWKTSLPWPKRYR